MNPIRKQRVYALVAILLGVSVAIFLVLNGLKQNLNLFYTPTQVIKENLLEVNKLARVGGMVKDNSFTEHTNSLMKSFEITDFNESIMVVYKGILPDLFSEGSGVVVQGMLTEEGSFEASEVLAKHDENYMPPEVAKTLKYK